MKPISILRLGLALLLFQFQAPGLYAQENAQEKMHEGRGDDNQADVHQPHRHQQPPGPTTPEPKKPQPPLSMGHDHHPQHSTRQARAWQRHRGWEKQGAWQAHDSWDGGRATHWQSEHRTWAQRGGYGGRFVPRNNFRLYFGPKHAFRIEEQPVMYMGYPRFAYHGYSFLLVDPWPEDWDPRWYARDELYIDYEDGYYLHNRNHPEAVLAISLVD